MSHHSTGATQLDRRTLLVVALLMPVGPACVAAVRFLLPYFTASDSAETVAKVVAAQGRQSAVVWLGYVATLTLVPGVLAAARVTRDAAPRLTTWAVALLVPAYLSMGALLSSDLLLWSGATAGVEPGTVTTLFDQEHPTVVIGIIVFVVGHVVGTVLLGLAMLRSRRIPAAAAWALTISQPLHFVAAVVVGSRHLDLFAWGLTAVGMGFAARALLQQDAVGAGGQAPADGLLASTPR